MAAQLSKASPLECGQLEKSHQALVTQRGSSISEGSYPELSGQQGTRSACLLQLQVSGQLCQCPSPSPGGT